MATYAEAGTFAFTTIANTEFKPTKATVQRDVSFVETTGSGDTAVEWTQAGLRYFSGTVIGFLEIDAATGPGYDVDTDTATMAVASAQDVSGAVVLERISAIHDYSGRSQKLIPVAYAYKYTGAITIE